MDNELFDNYAELVARFKSGDESAYERLYEQTKQLVYTTCLGILKNEDDAFDAMQETYLTVYRKIVNLKDDKAFVAWIKKIASSKALTLYKKKKGNVSYDDAVAVDESLLLDDDLESLPDSYIMEKTKREALDKIIKESLSDVQYQTIHMHYYGELSVETIAELMECPVGTVKTRLMKSRAKIKEGVKKYETDNKDAFAATPAVPFLTRFFNANSDDLKIPNINFSTLIGDQASNVVPAIADAVTQIASNDTVKDVAKGGFLTTTVAKIIAGALIVTVPVAAVISVKGYLDRNKVVEESVAVITETTAEPTATATPTPAPTDTPTPTPIPTVELSSSEYWTDYPLVNELDFIWVPDPNDPDNSYINDGHTLESIGYSVYVRNIEGTRLTTSLMCNWNEYNIFAPDQEFNLSYDEYYDLFECSVNIESDEGQMTSYGSLLSGTVDIGSFSYDSDIQPYSDVTRLSEDGEPYIEDWQGTIYQFELVATSDNGHSIYREDRSPYLVYISPIDDTHYVSWVFYGGEEDTYYQNYIDDMDYVVVEDGYEVIVVP